MNVWSLLPFFPRRPAVALHFMHNTDPDTYHNECSLEIQQELASREHEDYLERRAESIRAQQQDADDQSDDQT